MSSSQRNEARTITVDPSLAEILRFKTLLVLEFNHEPFEDVRDLAPGELLALASILLTNFQDWDSGVDLREPWDGFRLTAWRERRPHDGPMTMIQRVGAWGAVDHADLEAVLRPMLERDVDVRRLIAKGVSVIRDAANRSNGIGRDLSVVVIPRDPHEASWTEYHPQSQEHRVVLPMQVIARPGLTLAMHAQIEAEDPANTAPMAGPLRSRSAPCYCGSGKKYKRCHGV
jgi:hypothetical protein